MKNSKVIKTGKMAPVRGGSGHMSGKNSAGPQTPGQTAAGGAKKAAPFTSAAKAGGKKMVGFTGAKPSKPGVTK